jgi:hypothetical protein
MKNVPSLLVCALALLCLGVAPVSAQTGRLHGRVTDSRSGAPVPSAIVYLTGATGTEFKATNHTGAYTFQNLTAGRYRVRVLHPGFEAVALEIDLHAQSGMEVDVPLELRAVRSPTLSVIAQRAPVGDDVEERITPDLARRAQEFRWLGAGPHSASALSDMVATQVAARANPDGRSAPHVLYVWGTNTDQGRVLLDGAPLGAPLHLGGLLPPLDADLLATARYHSGGSSPRFDGGTMHVMEFRTRPVRERANAWGEVDALAARAGFEVPVGNGGVFASGRRVNSEVIEWITNRPLGYDYADVLARTDLRPSPVDRLHATAFATNEAITIPRDLGEDDASWQNLALSAGWTRATDAETSLNVSYGRATADLPYLRALSAHVVSTVEHTALTAAHRTFGPSLSTAVGFDLEQIHFGRRASGITSEEQLADSGCRSDATCLDEGLTMLAAYGELALQPRAGWSLSTGVRLSYDATHGSIIALPRASVTAVLDDRHALTLSAGRYSRASVHDSASAADAMIPLADMEGSHSLSPRTFMATASHVQLSVVRRTARSTAGASAILRRHDEVPGRAARTSPGFEMWWLHSAGPLDASLGYSYLRRVSQADTSGTLRDRHVLAASIGRSTGPARFNLAAAWAVGLPFVSLALDDPDAAPIVTASEGATLPGTSPEGTYLRIDASATATWQVNWLDREASVTPYVKLVNALGRRDALFFFRETGAGGQLRALAAVPLVPTLGIRWSF